MANRKDMRRPDLIVPYVEPQSDAKENDVSSTMSSTLPMLAIVTRNKFAGWAAMVLAVQSWLSETPAQRAKSSTPGYFSVLMAFMALAVCYMQLFFPPPAARAAGSSTGAAPPAPQ